MNPNKEVGPFTVERELGSGSMGSVYLARYKNGQRVALKFLGAGVLSSTKAAERFEREAEILKQLKHPNIVRLFGHGKHQKMPYYAMEYVEGQTLAQILEQRGRLPWEEVVRLGRQLCAALQHAHEQGIIHRDVKPSNLMVLADGTLKLTDFGIAKDLDVTQLTSANCAVGTASYMSPEQCKGERNLSHKSDLYALGIVLYELLTGHKPFEAESIMDLFLLHVQGDFERPSRVVMDVPPWLDTLICQLLEKKPDRRPFDAAFVGAALEEIAEKVKAQKSAGVDALTGGMTMTGTRMTARTLTSEDKEAARTLAKSLGKGGKKKRKKPIYKRVWFQAASIILALLAIGGIIFLAAQPPNPDRLYKEAKRLMESGDPAKRELARRDAIAKYLQYHKKKMAGSEQLQQIQAWADEMDTEQRESTLLHRRKAGITPEGSSERTARRAIDQEENGDLNDAEATWQALEQYKTDTGEHDDRILALLAKKHLVDFAKVKTRLQELDRKVDEIQDNPDKKPNSESSEGFAIKALLYERYGDAALAARTWQRVKGDNDKESSDRIWLLLAARKEKEQNGNKPKQEEERAKRRELVKARLEAAKKLASDGKKLEAQRKLSELVELYGERNEVQDEVEQAKALLNELRRP
jgi:serine/threonine-protein kinase